METSINDTPKAAKEALGINKEALDYSHGGVLDTSPVSPQPFITSDAKAAVGEVELIGGYVYADKTTGDVKLLNKVVMKEFSGHEEDIMTDAALDIDQRFHRMIASCMVRIGDGAGTYITDQSKMYGIVDELTVSDRWQLLIFMRIISVSNEFTFDANCPGCNHNFLKTTDLNELKKHAMPDPSERIYDVTVPSGKSCRCQVMLGKHESRTTQDAGKNILSISLMARVLEIDGKPVTMSSIKDLSMRDRNFLRNEYKRREGGVDMEIFMSCGACNRKFVADIDMAQKSFFFPTST